jgi:hypothetical protein
MFRNMRLYPMILALAVLTTFFSGGLTIIAEGSSFSDTAEAEWAHQAMAEMSASEVLNGYPGGVFKPYNNVTKLEAVAMLVRVLGLEDQALALDKDDVDYEMPPDLYWGSGNLIMAVQLGMLDGDYLYLLQPNSPATRTEVAMLVFHALDFSPDSSAMEFEDADQIPSEYREGVAAVVKNNLIKGLPGNLFKPNDNINRAQMAVLLSRIVAFKYADPIPARRAEGVISDISVDSRIITISSAGSIFYTSDCEVFLGGISISPDKLEVGDEVDLILNEDQHALFINALRPGEELSYKGKVSFLQTVNSEYWLGIIREDGVEFTRQAADGVLVNKAGSKLNISTLNEGDNIEILVSANKIIEINFSGNSGSLEGIISDLDTTGNWGITIRSEDEDAAKYVVVEEAIVLRDGESIEFSDLNEGESVRLKLNDTGQVYYIEVLASNTALLEGEIRDVDTIGTLGIAIRNDDGHTTEYVVSDGVEAEQEGDSIDFSDLDEGVRVRLKLDSRDRVYFIEVIAGEYSVIEGTVDELVTDRSPFIRIIKSNGTRTQYDIDRNAGYYQDGKRIDLNDIVIGAEVKARVNENDEVTRIDITNDEDIALEGTVIYVSDSDNRIRIEQVSGSRFTYYFANDPDLEDEAGANIAIEDIEEESEVRIELEKGEITSLNVL